VKRSKIRELTKSIVKYDELSTKDLEWIFSNLSRQELKLFMRFLSREIKDNTVIASFAGELSYENKKKINAIFPNKKNLFKRDDENIFGGVRFQYGDFVLDYSISGMIKRILNGIKENL
jgi:F-type H+-transporting ATPase subunit delta